MKHDKVRRYNKSDFSRLRTLMERPDVAPWLQDDESRKQQIAVLLNRMLRMPEIYMLGRDPSTEVFTYSPHHGTAYQAHVVVHPDHRGKGSMLAARESAKRILTETPCKAVLTFIPADNRSCLAFVRVIGMRPVGKTEGTFCRNGVFYDEHIFQATLKDYEQTKERW